MRTRFLPETVAMRVVLARGVGVVLLLSAAAAGFLRSDQHTDTEAKQIDSLIRQLGAERSAVRETASRELRTLGVKALPALRQAALPGNHPEVRSRAQQLVRDIIPASQKSKSSGLAMVLVEAGEFLMGAPIAEVNRRPDEVLHNVRISQPFYLGVHEVTQEEYQKVMQTNPSWFASTGDGKAKVAGIETKRFPVENVSWYDAVDFCNRLSKLDGLEPYYRLADVKRENGAIQKAAVTSAGGDGYRLPSEAEWEYACREWSLHAFHFGRANTGRQANLKPSPGAGGYGGGPTWPALNRTSVVGAYPANQWGLHDMHGNVAEWCGDWYHKDYYAQAPTKDPPGPKQGDHRVLRGGSWLLAEGSCRSASRAAHLPQERTYYTGFRVARNP